MQAARRGRIGKVLLLALWWELHAFKYLRIED